MIRSWGPILCLVLGVCAASAQDTIGGRFHGLVVGDLFYKSGGDDKPYGGVSQYNQPGQPLPKDSSGFQIRRIHFFYDYTFSREFFTRIQLEGNDKSLEPGGRQGLYVKTVYGEWRNIFAGSNLLLGLIPTFTWASVEGVWGYRSVEKTIMDFRNLGSGSDMGVQLHGSIPAAIPAHYAVMVGNGNGQKPENNRSKKYYALMDAAPLPGFFLEAYADFEPGEHGDDRGTAKAFLSYQGSAFMVGTELMQQVQKNQDTLHTDDAQYGLSLFSWYKLSEEWKAFGRVDYYDPNRFSANSEFYEIFFSFGVDYTPAKNFHLIPNLWVNTFTDKSSAGRTKKADVVPRLTFFFAYD